MTSTGIFCERVHEQQALFWRAWDDEPLDAIEIPAALLIGVGLGAGRQGSRNLWRRRGGTRDAARI